jgi:ferredoxin--NADP+ reductase
MIKRFISFLERHTSFRMSKNLDKMIAAADAKGADLDGLTVGGERAKPRMPFDSGLPFSEASFSKLTFANVREMLGVMPRLSRNMSRSAGFYAENFPATSDTAPPEFFAELEALAIELGASQIGYISDLTDAEIFRHKGVPHRHAIVFTVEMDRDEMEKSPDFASFIEVAKGYKNLAIISNALTEFMRSRGFAGYPGTALGGLTDYVAVGERAGLGAIGYHGLLITPEAGARVRINTIYTNIENLPRRENPHRWVRDVCASCRKCIRSCPPGALYDEPRERDDSHGKVAIEYAACLDYFSREFGCAVCLAVCPFSAVGYAEVRREHLAHKVAAAPAPAPTAPVDRPLRVGVVGAGPAGFYLTQALTRAGEDVHVDLFERLPSPHGLVRYGVAPDHDEVKSKSFVFDQILAHDRVRYFGNVAFGADLTRAEALQHYDAIAYTVGASQDRDLGIPGEDLPGSLSATSFVAWYNGHPDHQDLSPPVGRAREVAVVGLGNVALDVTRMLLTDPDALAATDLAPGALAALRGADVQDVHIIGRRGPSQANFTPKELRELSELPGVQVLVDPDHIARDRPGDDADDRAARNLELFTGFSKDHGTPRAPGVRRVHVHFFASPVEVLGSDRVEGVRIEHNALVERGGRLRPEGTGEHTELGCGMLLRSVGYRSAPLPDVPFDPARGVIPNADGRVLGADDRVRPREYASGWVRRGPSGVIGTNKTDAEEVARHIVADLDALHPDVRPEPDAILGLLEAKGARVVTAEDWRYLAREEKWRGSRVGRRAIKFTSVEAMLDALDRRHAMIC